MPLSDTVYSALDVNIDKYIDPILPHNLVAHLPTPISHFLGYRKTTPKEPPALIRWILLVLSTVAGICLVGGVYNYAPGINKWQPPPIVASLGASAILQYNAVRSPLAQPRQAIIGHPIAAIVGTAISKAFQHDPSFFANYGWVAGAIACASASLAMSMTGTVHPPGGATAILACTEAQIIALGWMFPPLMLLASVLMTAVACIFNNTLRQYPVYWWTPEEVGWKLSRRQNDNASEDPEKGQSMEKMHRSETSSSDRTLAHHLDCEVESLDGVNELHILPYKLRIPGQLELSEEEMAFVERLQARMRQNSETN